MKHIWIMRHATTENGSKDYERHITEQGKAECIKAAQWLKKTGKLPSLVLCSSATRTKETASLLFKQLGDGAQIEFINKLYRADGDIILKHLQLIDDKYEAVMIIAHNPGVYEFSRDFTIRNHELLKTTVPASIAYFTADSAWASLSTAHGNLHSFFVP